MIPYDVKIKKQAKKLRAKGLSYNQIAKSLKISKSTVKYWCHDVVLKKSDKLRLYTARIANLSHGPNSSHERRYAEIREIRKKAEKEISFPLSMDAYKLFGAALYWAEGNKITDFTITNSDPLLIQFMTQWFCDIFQVTPLNMKAHLNIYPQQNDVELKKFWSDITKIPITNFGKSFIKPVNKNYKKNTLYYGTIKVRVAKGTNFRHRVFGWIHAVLKEIKSDVEITKKKWYKLESGYARP
jgi:transcriptional regulator with XRE-family HTH domain